MTEQKNNGLIMTLLVLIIASLLLGSVFSVLIISKNNELNDKVNKLSLPSVDLSPLENQVKTLQETIGNLKSLLSNSSNKTSVDVSDNSEIERICELVDGCKFYEITGVNKDNAVNEVSSEVPNGEKFIDAFSSLVKINKDYLTINSTELKDSKVIAMTKKDKEKENDKVQIFYKVQYKDVDKDNFKIIYILVSSTLDNGNFSSLSVKEVERTFSFD